MRPELAAIEAPPELRTERTRLRAMELDDAGELHAFFSDAETMRYWRDSSLPHADERSTREMIASIEAAFAERRVLQWAIERDSDRRLLGTITLIPAAQQPRAELGYMIGREHWRQGYAGEAQRRVVRFAFEELGLHRLEADTHPDNSASSRSLERLGFRREGLLRERWVVDGKPSDSLIWGLLAQEWRSREEEADGSAPS
jgi:[ribosomal protein S5]-alanine N-acetyltransferase